MSDKNLFRLIPSVDRLLSEKWAIDLSKRYDRNYLKVVIERLLGQVRAEIDKGQLSLSQVQEKITDLKLSVMDALEKQVHSHLKRVINCTGVVVHTNLGRSPFPKNIFSRVADMAAGYMNLEFDLNKGKRSNRNVILDDIVGEMFPGYKSVVVNNNAAAVMLVLNSFAADKEVIISRGQLVEIGGSFRIPDVMTKSGSILREVGTTNKTKLADYEKAINANTGMLMTVHPSNYRITGFTASVEPWELIDLAKEHNLPLYHDMGSGNLFSDLILGDERTVNELVKRGIPLFSFSGDKLLGGVQAGIILGRPHLIDVIRENQLLRALRVDKIVYLLLEELFRLYLTGEYRSDLPIYKMLRLGIEELQIRISKFVEKIKSKNLQIEIVKGSSQIGGGAAPDLKLPAFLIGLTHKSLTPLNLQQALRSADTPVIARIEDDRVVLDFRTVFEDDEEMLADVLSRL